MKLEDVVRRRIPPEPWAEGDKIPWDDPAFSRRMLREHLSQAHDLASRRSSIIDQHVGWIHHALLGGKPGRILDLGCGPGLYASRLAALGHHCLGIDFSPASIEYADDNSVATSGSASYLFGDIREVEYGSGYDLAMFIFGELNMFRRDDAGSILRKVRGALARGGLLLLEAHSFESIEAMGRQPASWRTAESGLFAEGPHVILSEHFWHEETRVATERTFVIHAGSARVDRYVETAQAYTLEDYRAFLGASGFVLRESMPALPGSPDTGEFVVLVAAADETVTAR